MDLSQVMQCFAKCGYQIQHETKKAVGFKTPKQRRVAYLRKDSGLPARVRIVVDPDFSAEGLFGLDGASCPRNALQHGANMHMLPRRRNKGATDISFGRAIDVMTLDGLDRVLAAYDV